MCVRNACERVWKSASERVRVVVREGERLRMHVGARESAFSESAPESVCLRMHARVRLKVCM